MNHKCTKHAIKWTIYVQILTVSVLSSLSPFCSSSNHGVQSHGSFHIFNLVALITSHLTLFSKSSYFHFPLCWQHLEDELQLSWELMSRRSYRSMLSFVWKTWQHLGDQEDASYLGQKGNNKCHKVTMIILTHKGATIIP